MVETHPLQAANPAEPTPHMHPEAFAPAAERGADFGPRVGSLVLRSEVEVSDAYIQDGIAALNAEANGATVRPEDAGRIHDIEEARAAAELENEIFDAHVEALRENELFDAHTEALAEDKTRSAQPEGQVPSSPAKTEAPQSLTEKRAADYKKEVADTLVSIGITDKLPTGSQITKDELTGNLIITDDHSHNVRIIERQPGGPPSVTDYKFNEDKQLLTISVNGANLTLTPQGNYEQAASLDRQPAGAVTLPPAVARAVGFQTAVPVASS